MENIIVGRDEKDLKKYKDTGTAFLGMHIVGQGEEAHLTNPIVMDVSRPHVILICGKRGTGKSYTGGIVAEEISKLPDDVKNNLTVVMIDTMGIYWSMKLPNEKDAELLKEWKIKPAGVPIKLFVPKGYVKDYQDANIEVDFPFSVSISELASEDWIVTFGFSPIDEYGILIERSIKTVKEKYGEEYSIQDIVSVIEKDKRSEEKIKDALINRFLAADNWGIFDKEGTRIDDILQPGTISVVDVSHYMRVSGAWSIRGMVVGLISRKIFTERLKARKIEEYGMMTGDVKKTVPMVWLIMDEAHQFIPNKGITAASEALLTLAKEGREPGISMALITQRPNKLHEDILSQADLIISHRLTSKADFDALRSIMQTYMMEDLEEYINSLPRQKGTAIVLDDNSERVFTMNVRPRLSWHAGGSPTAIKEKTIFE
jgi:DNA helicase HerA-like ATPase